MLRTTRTSYWYTSRYASHVYVYIFCTS